MSLDLDNLEKIARAAPGEWRKAVYLTEPPKFQQIASGAKGDADFVESFNPAVALEIIAEIRRLREVLSFYANEDHYDEGLGWERAISRVQLDKGFRATEALAK